MDEDGTHAAGTWNVIVENVAPTITAFSGPATGVERQSLAFTVNATDAAGLNDPLTYMLDFGDGSAVGAGTLSGGVEVILAHTYLDNGSFTVTLVVADGDGGSTQQTMSVVVANVAPTFTTGFSGDTTGNEGSELTFTASANDIAGSNDPLTYVWDFGDGSPIVSGVDLTSVTHRYADNGSYTLALTVSDGDGGKVEDTRIIRINNVAPAILSALAGSTTGDENTRFAFSATASDVAGVRDPLTYEWNFGDGSPVVSSVDRTIESYVYADNGNYTVTLTIIDGDGGQLVQTLPVTVRNVAPVIHGLTGPATGIEGNVFQFRGRATDQAGANDPLMYNWEVFREGTVAAVDAESGIELTDLLFVPEDEGRFTIKLTVDDGNGGRTSKTWSTIIEGVTIDVLTVANSNPTLRFDANQTIAEGSSFDLNALFQDAGALDTQLATVDWGDGSGVEPGVVDEAAGRITGMHTYRQDGTYTVTVRIRDNDMPSDTWVAGTFALTVTNVVPIADAGRDIATEAGKPITLQGSFLDPGRLDVHTFQWQVSTGNAQEIPDGAGQDFTFTPNDAGSYVLTFTVRDNAGSSSDQVVVEVVNRPPTAIAGDAQTVDEGDLVTLHGTFTDEDPGNTHSFLWQVSADNGQVIKNGRGQDFSFTPRDNGLYTATFTVADNQGGQHSDTLTVTVNNVAPTADAGGDRTVREGDRVRLEGLFTDPGTADNHTFLWQVSAANGQVVADGVERNFAFTPEDNGEYAVTFTVTDAEGAEMTSNTVIVTVDNAAPTAYSGGDETVFAGQLVTLLGTFTDVGAADTHTFLWKVVANNGQVVADGVEQDFVFTPQNVGRYTVKFTVTDDDGGKASDSVVVTVVGVNELPVPLPDSGHGFSTDSRTRFTTISVLANDTDPNSSDTLSVVGLDSSGTIGAVSDRGNGHFSYDPHGQFDSLQTGETATDTFTYTVSDGRGGTATATVTITVIGGFDDAEGDGVSKTIEDGAPNNGDGNDDGIPDSQQEDVVSLPNAADGGYITLVSEVGTLADVQARENPSPSDAPPTADFEVDFLTFTVQDIDPGGAITVTLFLENDGPFNTYYKYGREPSPDPANPDPALNAIHWYEFVYDPATNTGAKIFSDRIELHLVDGGRGDGDLTANGVILDPGGVATRANTAPVAVDDGGAGFTTGEHSPFTTANVLANDSDPESASGDRVAFKSFDVTGTKGQVQYNGDGTFRYDPQGAFASLAIGDHATDVFRYTIRDNLGASHTATVTITVVGANESPTVALQNAVTSLPENITAKTKVADIVVTDDGLGTNVLSLSGVDAGLFEIVGAELYLKAGQDVDFETHPILNVTVEVNDATLGGTPDDGVALAVAVTDVNESPTVALQNAVTSLPENITAQTKVADIAVTDDGLGTNVLSLSGVDAGLFEIVGAELYLKAGQNVDFETNPVLNVTVEVNDATLGGTPDDGVALAVAVTDVNESPTVALQNAVTSLPENITAQTKVADIVVTDDGLGTNVLSLSGVDAGLFEIVGAELYLKAGQNVDFETNPVLNVTVEVNDAALGGAVEDSEALTIAVLDASPGVTLSPAAGQRNPTNQKTIHFTVVFTDPVKDFATGNVSLSGTAPGKLVGKVKALDKTGLTYDVAVSGMKGDGTVIASIGAGVAHDAAGHGNLLSAASLITRDTTKPTVTINQAANQADPTTATSAHFTVVFSEPVIGFTSGDVKLSGKARGKRVESVTALDGGRTYDVLVSGVTGNGTVIASVKAGVAQDAAGNKNRASTSTDKTVTFGVTPHGPLGISAAHGRRGRSIAWHRHEFARCPGQRVEIALAGGRASERRYVPRPGIESPERTLRPAPSPRQRSSGVDVG